MYAGPEPVVHLVQKPPHETRRGPDTGELDHVALGAEKLDLMRDTLNQRGIAFREAIVPRDGSVQLFVHDPDGILLELNFVSPNA
jgi:catechol 2,3-dioxygenase-like lactoylglutathione lyase family enzyme